MTKLIKPAPGRQMRRPDQGFTVLPDEGAPVEWSPYWERALTEGDIVLVDASEEAPKKGKPGGNS